MSWVVWKTNRFDSTDLHYPTNYPASTFYRVRRYEPPDACGASICSAETNSAVCLSYGPPDEPSFRDAAIPTPATQIKTVRLLVHVVADDRGLNAAVPFQRVIDQMRTLNDRFRSYQIQFVWRTNLIRSNPYRRLLSRAHAVEMMTNLAVNPASEHNIFVTDTPPGILGVSAFPWQTDAAGQPVYLTSAGSTAISRRRFGSNEVNLVHELGHAFGLWHTKHGVEEVGNTSCPPCWEHANASRAEADRTGDRCSDTPPTPLNENFVVTTLTDRCSGFAWPLENLNNYMSSAPWKQGRFTPQQAGRMHAWIDHRLRGWLDTNTPAMPTDLRVEANDFGEVELNWTDNSWNETGFRIERFTLETGWTNIAIVPANTVSFFDDNSLPLRTNTYRVIAINTNATNFPGGMASSYSTYPDRSTVPGPISQIVYLDAGFPGNSTPDGTITNPFSTFAQALNSTPERSNRIFRVSAAHYREPILISNRTVRVEARGGSVVIGERKENSP